MKRLIFVIPAFYTGIIQPGSLSSSCSLDGNVQVDFSYEPADTDLDSAFVGAADSTGCIFLKIQLLKYELSNHYFTIVFTNYEYNTKNTPCTSCGLGSGQVALTKIDESDGTWRITYEPD